MRWRRATSPKRNGFYTALLQHHPDNFDALHGLGLINYQRGRLDAALALIQAALQSDLTRADGFASLGLVFHALKDFARALVSYDEGLRLEPDNGELLNRRGVTLLELKRPREALASFDCLLAAAPAHLDALGNRGNALLKLNRVAEALAAYDRALQLAPKNAQLLTNRAVALRRLDRPQEALMSATSALLCKPDFAQARFVESVARLTMGDFARGWDCYEARWQVGWLASQRRDFAAPLWLGKESLAGKTILLHAEQGLGDTIQFVRYAPLLAARGATVVLEVQQPLVRLLSRLPGVAAVVARKEPLPRYDYHCPLLSLPFACATTLETIPADIPYLAAADADVALGGCTCRSGGASAWSGPASARTTTTSIVRCALRRLRRCSICPALRLSVCSTKCAKRMRHCCKAAPMAAADRTEIQGLCRHRRRDRVARRGDCGRYRGRASGRGHGQAAVFAAAVRRGFPLVARARRQSLVSDRAAVSATAIRRLGLRRENIATGTDAVRNPSGQGSVN